MNCHGKRCVITGAPCSGKSTVIRGLESLGYFVVHEAARNYIDTQLRMGRTMEDIRGNALAFQQALLYQKQKNEENLPEKELIFLDRGIPDSIAYYRLYRLPADEALALSRRYFYHKIFFFRMLPFANDRARNEDEQTARKLARLIYEAYRMLDYEIIPVPLMPVRERIAYVLNHL
ncbi:MAG: ATP-binding protein [Desulfococcaceae bacterium]|jgi:predicted ATPase|nr:ATP-binding protein [Desulfococcaceae bacterium]